MREEQAQVGLPSLEAEPAANTRTRQCQHARLHTHNRLGMCQERAPTCRNTHATHRKPRQFSSRQQDLQCDHLNEVKQESQLRKDVPSVRWDPHRPHLHTISHPVEQKQTRNMGNAEHSPA